MQTFTLNLAIVQKISFGYYKVSEFVPMSKFTLTWPRVLVYHFLLEVVCICM